jgi:hypothetical protein
MFDIDKYERRLAAGGEVLRIHETIRTYRDPYNAKAQAMDAICRSLHKLHDINDGLLGDATVDDVLRQFIRDVESDLAAPDMRESDPYWIKWAAASAMMHRARLQQF